MKKIIFLSFLSLAGNSFASDCEDLVEKMERGSTPIAEKKSLALKAVKSCKGEGHINAQIMLAWISNNEGNYEEAIKWNDEALKIAPQSPLPYMNKCASLMGHKKHDEAIEVCKKGLGLKQLGSDWKAKLNANIALAMYEKGVQNNDNSTILESEAYFLESSKLNPNIAQNHNYLGIINFFIKKKVPEAIAYYKKACDLGDTSGCKNLKDTEASEVAKVKKDSAPPSTNEKELYAKIRQGYVKSGVPAASIDSIIDNITKSLVQLTPEQRLQSLQTLAKSLE